MRSLHALRAWIGHAARLVFPRRPAVVGILAVVALALLAGTAAAATYAVTSTTDNGTGQTAGTLSYAIAQANANPGSTIGFNLQSGNTITLTGPLTPITANVTIDGTGTPGLKIDGGGTSAAFFVASGTVTIENLTVANANAVGGHGGSGDGGGGGGLGAGGALFVNSSANVTIQSVSFQNNSATGGAGGSGLTGGGGGGGGGFHGAGGSGSDGVNGGGGGGGGFVGAGGRAQFDSGGGGGGQYGNGGSPIYDGGGGGGGTQPGQNGSSGGIISGGAGGGTSGGHGGTDPSPGATSGSAGGGGGGASYRGGAAGNGGTYGGGGGGGYSASGRAGNGGDFGGGGGGGVLSGSSSAGGFGGGGGGAPQGSSSGSGGFGGGAGGSSGQGGAGGDGYGGAIFVRSGGTLTVIDSGISGSSVTAGAGGSGAANGSAAGAGLYLMSSTTSTIEVDSGTQTISDSIAGAGGLTKTGAGILTLSGTNDYTGTTEVAGGTLNLTGSNDHTSTTEVAAGRLNLIGATTSNTTVDSGAVLSGNGTITGNLTNGGTVGLGGSIGTLTVSGNYTQNSGGNLQIGVNSSGGNSLLNVSGTANLAGTVEVEPVAGSYISGTRYVFLEASSILGTFSGITLDNLSTMHAVLGYDATDVYFTLLANQSNFAADAHTLNQLAVANYIDANSTNPNGPWQSLITALNSLSSSGVQNALDQMSGALYGSVAQTDFQSSTLELSLISNRIASGLTGGLGGGGFASGGSAFGSQMGTLASTGSADLVVRGQNTFWPVRRPSGNWSTWGFGYGLGGNAQGNSNAAGLNYSLGGTVVGLESLDDNKLQGFYAGYIGSHLGSYLAGQSIGVNGGQLGFYRRVDDGRNYYILLGGLGADGYDSHRLMQFGGINTTANANYGGWQSQAYLERGITLQGSRASIQPYAALQYLYVRQNSFTETGAGVMDLKVAGIDANSLRSIVGIRLAGSGGLSIGGRKITPVARALWLHEFLSTSTGLNAQFAPIGGTNFAVTGTSLGRDWAILGTGLNWNLGRGWQAYANYDAQVNAVQTFHVGSGGFQYTW